MQAKFNAATAIWPGSSTSSSRPASRSMSRVPMGSNGGDLSESCSSAGRSSRRGCPPKSSQRMAALARGTRRLLARVAPRAVAAIDEGRFADEIVPIEVTNPHARRRLRRRRNAEARHICRALAALKPAFSRTEGHRRQLHTDLRRRRCGPDRERPPPTGSVSSRGPASCRSGSPASILTGCSTAIRRRARRAWRGRPRLGRRDGDRGQRSVRVCRTPIHARHKASSEPLGDINPNGGGICWTPLGATGARITATLVNELERRAARFGIATMCIGFGQAIAAVIEKL